MANLPIRFTQMGDEFEAGCARRAKVWVAQVLAIDCWRGRNELVAKGLVYIVVVLEDELIFLVFAVDLVVI